MLLEYCHTSLTLGNVGVLYLKDRNVYRPVLKNYIFFSKNFSGILFVYLELCLQIVSSHLYVLLLLLLLH